MLGLIALLGSGSQSAVAAAGPVERGDVPSAAFTDRQIVEGWGWLIAHQENVVGIEISASELGALADGFVSGLENQPAPQAAAGQRIVDDVDIVSRARRAKLVHVIVEKNESAAAAFFAGLKKDPAVVAMPGGTFCKVLRAGEGPHPKLRQTVKVHYTANLIDGTEFGQMEGVELVLVENRSVCRGWLDAVQKIGAGGEVLLFVPPPLPSEEADKWGIQPGSTMILRIELLAVRDTESPDLENALLPPAPEPPPPIRSEIGETEVIRRWGWNLARESRANRFELMADEATALARGLTAGIRGEPPPVAWAKLGPAVKSYVVDRREKVRQSTAEKRHREMETLFASLKRNPKVVELADGLRYEVCRPGTGPHPKRGQVVVVKYTGRLANGTVFDRTDNEPLHIEIGSVIDGLNEGLQKVAVGGQIKLYVPPWLGYGEKDSSGVVGAIPGNSVLIYDIELRAIEDPAHESAAAGGAPR